MRGACVLLLVLAQILGAPKTALAATACSRGECQSSTLPDASSTTLGVTLLELSEMAQKLNCEALAQKRGYAQSLKPYPKGMGGGLDFTTTGEIGFKACKVPEGNLAATWAASWEGFTSAPRCVWNAGYGLVVDGAWGDVEFLLGIASFAAKEGARGMIEGIPFFGEELVHSMFEDKRTHQQMADDMTCSMVASVEKIRVYLATPEGRENLEVVMCMNSNQQFQMAMQLQMFRKVSQTLIDASPTLAAKIAETPCDDLVQAMCGVGGMLSWELVSDTVYEVGAVALGVTGVAAAGGVALGVGAIAKSVGKLALKSVDAAAALLRFLAKTFPDLLDVRKVLDVLLPNEIDPSLAKKVGDAYKDAGALPTQPRAVRPAPRAPPRPPGSFAGVPSDPSVESALTTRMRAAQDPGSFSAVQQDTDEYYRAQARKINEVAAANGTYRVLPMSEHYYGEDLGFSSSKNPWARGHIKYLTDAERAPLKVSIENGRLMQNGKPLDTSTASKNLNGKQTAIWVMDNEGNFYVSNYHGDGIFHHSSLSGGKPVAAVGELQTDASGKIISINDNSGHYTPQRPFTNQAVDELRAQGVDIGPENLDYYAGEKIGFYQAERYRGLGWKELEDSIETQPVSPFAPMGQPPPGGNLPTYSPR